VILTRTPAERSETHFVTAITLGDKAGELL